MKLGIVGNGVVGNATGKAFVAHGHEVLYWDVREERATVSLLEVTHADILFLCLPTPQRSNSLGCDTTFIEEFFRCLHGRDKQANIVLRSTVPVGYTRQASKRYGLPNLIHWPEFLTARKAEGDAKNPNHLIFGGPAGPLRTMLCKLIDETWPNVTKTLLFSTDESEFVKLMQNALSAVKLAAINECCLFAQRSGMNWDHCLTALLGQGWINPMHTQVPGPDGKRGFGGSCLPKDAANLADCIDRAFGDKEHSVMIKSALCRNKEFDRREQ